MCALPCVAMHCGMFCNQTRYPLRTKSLTAAFSGALASIYCITFFCGRSSSNMEQLSLPIKHKYCQPFAPLSSARLFDWRINQCQTLSSSDLCPCFGWRINQCQPFAPLTAALLLDSGLINATYCCALPFLINQGTIGVPPRGAVLPAAKPATLTQLLSYALVMFCFEG